MKSAIVFLGFILSINCYAQKDEYYLNLAVVVRSHSGEVFYYKKNSRDYFIAPRIDGQDGKPKEILDDKKQQFKNLTQILNHFKSKGYVVHQYHIRDLHWFNRNLQSPKNSPPEPALVVGDYHVAHILLKKQD